MFEQERVITRLQQAVGREAAIQVCFLSGSFGRRTADAYSDLDVALVFESAAARDDAYGRRRDFAQAVMPYVPVKSFDATHVRSYFHIALYANGCKVDFRYEVQTDLQPSYWDRDIRLLKDSAGWGERFAAESRHAAAPTAPHITAAQLERLDHRLWIMVWDVHRLLQRGDHDKPFPIYIELLHLTLPQLLPLLPAGDPARQKLIDLLYTRDAAQTAAHLRQLLTAYLAVRSAIVRQHRLPFTPDNGFERQIQALMQR